MSEKQYGVWVMGKGGPDTWVLSAFNIGPWTGSHADAMAQVQKYSLQYGYLGRRYEVREYPQPEPSRCGLTECQGRPRCNICVASNADTSATIENSLAPPPKIVGTLHSLEAAAKLFWPAIRAAAIKHGAPADSADAIADDAVRLVLEQCRSDPAPQPTPPPASAAAAGSLSVPRTFAVVRPKWIGNHLVISGLRTPRDGG